MTPFNSQLAIYIGQNDIEAANSLIMQEMGKIVVNHRADFIDLLVNSDAPAHADFADEKLVDLYFETLPKKDLLVGSALLVNEYNKVSGFDGEMEMNDKAVKDTYRAMSSFLGGIPGIPDSAGYIQQHQFDWKYSGASGALGLAAKGINKLLDRKNASKAEMQKAIALEKQKVAERKAKNTRIALIVGGVVVGLGIIGILIYKLRKK